MSNEWPLLSTVLRADLVCDTSQRIVVTKLAVKWFYVRQKREIGQFEFALCESDETSAVQLSRCRLRASSLGCAVGERADTIVALPQKLLCSRRIQS